ncbi:MAG: S46 family peptidase [Planctomycetes bacterium]|nr:S46 family peptidase [Planctomycetota bacterium]
MTKNLARAVPSRRFPLSRALPALLLALALAPTTGAQERKELGRMWTFEHAPLGWFQQAYDWQPTRDWLDHARLSSLRLGRGGGYFCSASFVSPYGLIMTNHHCARDFIASVQGEHDWQHDGFYAGSYENEVKIPGARVSQLLEQRDVTAEVREQGQAAVIAQARKDQPGLEHQIISLYQGGNYQLYSHKIYGDLRLVCAPHGQSAHFGGDPDNFCFPRWGLDFAFLRAYENDQPADTSRFCFQWRTEGAKEGEAVFVTGNPGSTGRLQTVAQCEYQRDRNYPGLVQRMLDQLKSLYAEAEKSAADHKRLLPRILGVENSRKAFQGYLDGLRNPRIMAIKQKAEADLRAAVAKDPALQQKYGDTWDKIAAIQQQKVAAAGDAEKARELQQAEAALNKMVGEACFAVYGFTIPPDATMSLRISDGVVEGFPMNGTLAPYFTSLYGLFARHHEFGGKYPFDLPRPWLDAEQQLDLTTPFNFVSTCDIIGGNSGSPVIDKGQMVVGLVFDGNIESLGNRFVFDDEVARTVSVHPAIIIESLRKIYGAGRLADELERKGTPGDQQVEKPAGKPAEKPAEGPAGGK